MPRLARWPALGSCFLLLSAALAALSIVHRPAYAQGPAVTLEMGESGLQYSYTPKQITVPAGTVGLAFKNNGTRAHNFVLENLNQRIPDLDAGKTYEQTFTFSTPGTYQFICDLPLHAQRGMNGTLIVTAAQAPPPQATSPPTAVPATAVPAITAPTVAATAPATTAPATTAATLAPTTAPTVAPTAAPRATATVATSIQVLSGGTPRGTPLLISLAIHIPAAVLWLGIVLFDVFVVALPFLAPAQKGALLGGPRWLVVILIPIIMVTGIFQTINNPFNTVTDFASLEVLRNTTTYGFALFLKHGFVMMSFGFTLLVSFWLAPRLRAIPAVGADGRASLSRLLVWGNVAAALALVLCVSVMVYQLH